MVGEDVAQDDIGVEEGKGWHLAFHALHHLFSDASFEGVTFLLWCQWRLLRVALKGACRALHDGEAATDGTTVRSCVPFPGSGPWGAVQCRRHKDRDCPA